MLLPRTGFPVGADSLEALFAAEWRVGEHDVIGVGGLRLISEAGKRNPVGLGIDNAAKAPVDEERVVDRSRPGLELADVDNLPCTEIKRAAILDHPATQLQAPVDHGAPSISGMKRGGRHKGGWLKLFHQRTMAFATDHRNLGLQADPLRSKQEFAERVRGDQRQ